MYALPTETFDNLDEAQHSISISDARLPDMPLVYVNPGFEQFSGYSRDDVLGKNCRFLQNAYRDQAGVALIRSTVAARQSCVVDLVNFRKDGSVLHNRLSLQPVFDMKGELAYYVGLQTNIEVLQRLQNRISGYLAARSLHLRPIAA